MHNKTSSSRTKKPFRRLILKTSKSLEGKKSNFDSKYAIMQKYFNMMLIFIAKTIIS